MNDYEQDKRSFIGARDKELEDHPLLVQRKLQVELTSSRSPWHGLRCSYSGCSAQIIRSNDRIIACPGFNCHRVFHQDHYHNLLCWSLYYSEQQHCPSRGCNYNFVKELIEAQVATKCEECGAEATVIVPLAGDKEMGYHPLCAEHRSKYLQAYYRQELQTALRRHDAIAGSCAGSTCPHWSHDIDLAQVVYPPEGTTEICLCAACRQVLASCDQRTALRESFQLGLFRGMFPGTVTRGDVKLQYYRDVCQQYPQVNSNCIYCATPIRPYDRVAVCPQCHSVYHEDLPSELLCWSAHFDRHGNSSKTIYCAKPNCYYQLRTQR